MKLQSTWDLSKLLTNDSWEAIELDINASISKCREFINKWKDRKDYLSDIAALAEALNEYKLLNESYGVSGNAGYYLSLRAELNQEDSDIKAKINKTSDITLKIANDLQFFTHRLSKGVTKENQQKILNASELSEYKHFLEGLFLQGKYLLTEGEEKIMNLKSQSAFENWVRMTSEFISKENREVLDENKQPVKRNFSEILTLTSSTDKEVRDTAAKAANVILAKYSDIAEHEINSILQDKKVDDELRGFKRPDEARHMDDDIDASVVDAMIATVSDNFSLSNKFYEKKAQLLGLPKISYFERNVPYGEVSKSFTFEEGVDIVGRVFKRLDPEFYNIFESYLQNGQVDVFPHAGKTNLEFCTAGMRSQPGYILLNWGGKLEDVTTLAHEMGHAINNEFVRNHQHSLNFGTPLSTAEVASTFMEDFVVDEVQKSLGESARKAFAVSRVSDSVNTIFRQVACYLFEANLHKAFREKGYLSKKDIGELFLTHMSSFMGPFVSMDKGAENWWVYWSHIRSFFYVYSYASGLLISKAMQHMVRQDKNNIEKVKEFLSAGMSASPKDIFAKMDINITDKSFWEKGIKEISQDLENIK